MQTDSPGQTPGLMPPWPLVPALLPHLLPGPSVTLPCLDTETSIDLNVGGSTLSQCQQQPLGRTKSHPHTINKSIKADPRGDSGRG